MTVGEAVERGLMMNEFDLLLNSEVLIYEIEEEFNELMVQVSGFTNDKIVRSYIKKPYLYDVHLGSHTCHYQALLSYLYEQVKPGTTIELWNIWVIEIEKPSIKTIDLQNLTLKQLDKVLYRENRTCTLFIKN